MTLPDPGLDQHVHQSAPLLERHLPLGSPRQEFLGCPIGESDCPGDAEIFLESLLIALLDHLNVVMECLVHPGHVLHRNLLTHELFPEHLGQVKSEVHSGADATAHENAQVLE